MSKDYIAEQVSWLDGIITHPENPTLFNDDGLLAIQKELASRWSKENRLELLSDLAGKYSEERVLWIVSYESCGSLLKRLVSNIILKR
jgi:hypothetical protein